MRELYRVVVISTEYSRSESERRDLLRRREGDRRWAKNDDGQGLTNAVW
jgi:hypothetical protein